MLGVIFNLLETTVTEAHGPDAWDDLVSIANVSGVYTSLGSYPDEEIVALVDAASAALALEPAQVLHWFGRTAMPLLASRYGLFFEGHSNTRSFILSVNDIIHPEVRKLYTSAVCPHFHFEDDADGRLVVGYRSPRKLCALAHGFIDGASDHFHETAEIEHIACMLTGSPFCRIGVRWTQ